VLFTELGGAEVVQLIDVFIPDAELRRKVLVLSITLRCSGFCWSAANAAGSTRTRMSDIDIAS
jgi:hypothetical protein